MNIHIKNSIFIIVALRCLYQVIFNSFTAKDRVRRNIILLLDPMFYFFHG